MFLIVAAAVVASFVDVVVGGTLKKLSFVFHRVFSRFSYLDFERVCRSRSVSLCVCACCHRD